MVDVKWRFREMARAEINQDPMERVAFIEESINERLVREAIQNSLDASLARAEAPSAQTAGPVRMRFSLAGIRNPLSAERAAPYVDGLAEHLVAGLDGDFARRVKVRGLANDDLRFLVIEDMNTVGLDGDWEQYDDSEAESAKDNHFYWFFRNVGRSGKGDNDNGSWGLGKWVFPDASNASAYIAVTRRNSDSEMLLMGQAVLRKHNIDDRRHAPYGYFAEEGEDGLPLPLRSSDPQHRPLIEQCIADFDLRMREGSGLSVIIPFPRIEEHIDRPQLLAAVIHNYFYPIITGKLEVTVDDGDDDSAIEVNAETIDDVLESLELKDTGERSLASYQRLFDMCREGIALPDHRYINLATPPRNVPSYAQHSEVAELRRRYDSGQLLAFRISTMVERKPAGTREQTSFRLYVQHDDALTHGHDYYVRGTLSISEMDYIRRHHGRTLLVVDEAEPLAAMLRDSELPAHTYWRPQNERAGKRWVAASRRIKEISDSPGALLGIWEAAPVGLQKDALADIFPSGVYGSRLKRALSGSAKSTRPVKPDPLSVHQDFDIGQIAAGFRVSLRGDLVDSPNRIRLLAAYAAPRGNPIKNYSPHDFRLHGPGALDVRLTGCHRTPGDKGNELVLEVDDPAAFSVQVRGFDPHRDVYVDVKRFSTLSPTEGDE